MTHEAFIFARSAGLAIFNKHNINLTDILNLNYYDPELYSGLICYELDKPLFNLLFNKNQR